MLKFGWIVMVVLGCVSVSHQTEELFFQDTPTETTVTARLGGDVVIECKASGQSSPVIRWLRNGVPIVKRFPNHPAFHSDGSGQLGQPSEDLTSTTGRLYIDCVTERDAGVYTCVAETRTKQIQANTHLHTELADVQSALKVEECVTSRLTAGIPARVYAWTAIRLANDGDDVLLACRSEGTPTPTVSWFDVAGNHIDVQDDAHYQVQVNGDLLIRDVTWAGNMGVYRCVVENPAGTDSVESFLYPLRREN